MGTSKNKLELEKLEYSVIQIHLKKLKINKIQH